MIKNKAGIIFIADSDSNTSAPPSLQAAAEFCFFEKHSKN